MKRVSISVDYYELRKIIGMHKHEILKCQDRMDEVMSTNRYGIEDTFTFAMSMQYEINQHRRRINVLNKAMEQLKE